MFNMHSILIFGYLIKIYIDIIEKTMNKINKQHTFDILNIY